MSDRSLDETLAAPATEATLPSVASSREAEDALAAGEVVGRFVVLSLLGRGGMGMVYAAYDPELDRKVAIKVLRPALDGSRGPTDARSRLLREAQALAKFSHPEIVAVHDVGTHEGNVWVAMEFVEGITLGEWARAAPRRWPEIVAALLAAGRGVSAAHAAGLVHRDLKPDNIMIDADGRVRVMDFGLTRESARAPVATATDASAVTTAESSTLADPHTRHGSLLGTPAYMAPEQYAGGEITPATDQFAFCVTAWELLFGERPFAGHSVLELASAVLDGTIRTPAAAGRAPAWLRRALERGLSTDPARRWPAMAALLAELQLGRTRSRRRRVLLGGATLAALASAAIGWRAHGHAVRVDECTARGESIASIWSPATRERVATAFAADPNVFAAHALARVREQLDLRTEELARQTTLACTKHRVDRNWDADTFERATWCLEERELELESFVAELVDADAQVVRTSVNSAMSLTPAGPCMDPGALLLRATPPPADQREGAREIRVALARAQASLNAGDHEAALAAAREARTLADALAWPPLQAGAMQLEGSALDMAGEYAAAEASNRQAYFDAARAGAWDVAAAAANDLISTVGDMQARHLEGRTWADHAAIAIAHAGDPLGLREASRVTRLGHIALGEAKYDEAELLYSRSLELWVAAVGAEHPATAKSHNNLGNLYRARGDGERALASYQRAFALEERTLGAEHPDVAGALHNLGVVYDDLERHGEAKAALTRCLTIWKRSLGPRHPNVAMALVSIGSNAFATHDYEAAASYYSQAIELFEATLGPEHPNVALVLNNLGSVEFETGAIDESIAIHRRALAIREKVYGPDHPAVATSAFNLAAGLRRSGRAGEALPLLRRALANYGGVLPADDPELAWTLAEIGEVELELGEADQALRDLEAAVGTFTRHEGVQEGEAAARFALARALTRTQGDPVRALALAREARAGMEEVSPGARPTRDALDEWLRARGERP